MIALWSDSCFRRTEERATMPDVLVRGLSQEALEALKLQAAAHRRSLQQELKVTLEAKALRPAVDPVEAAREIRERLRDRGLLFNDAAELIRKDRDSR